MCLKIIYKSYVVFEKSYANQNEIINVKEGVLVLQIQCENITLGYDSKVITENLNFHINSGDYLLIVGENGCGKSTLVKSLLGLTPLLKGEVKFGDGLLKNEIGYLPQQSEHQQDFPASVFEVTISGCLNKCKWRPFYNKEEKARAMANLEKLGIAHLKNECFKNLSGGQRQRVLLARALCATTKLLLLDEPVSGLDPQTTDELYKLIDYLNEEITVIMISHDVQTSLNHASHVLKLGNNFFFGKIEDYTKFIENTEKGVSANG